MTSQAYAKEKEASRRPLQGLDLMTIPWLGRFLRWRWSRLIGQGVLLLAAALVIYDGFTGPQIASQNVATVSIWVHYRALLILALLLLGNLFCFACPFTIPRTLARKISLAGPRWPSALRNKWVSVGGLAGIFWLYEWQDLWASPWLTAYLILGYFASSFLLEALFHESAFCKYVCPLGAFNFTYSYASPLAIRTADADVCRACEGKECVNGSETVAGCGTELFVPTMQTNMDCTLCLDCARACPYHNVALVLRAPGGDLVRSPDSNRLSSSVMIVGLAAMGLLNAFGMVPPVYRLQAWLADLTGQSTDLLPLTIVMVSGGILIPLVAVLGAAKLSTLSTRESTPLREVASRYAPAFVPIGLGIWLAHYGFHLVVGGTTLLPVLQSFLLDHGLAWLGERANWQVGYLLPPELIFPLQSIAIGLGFLTSLYVVLERTPGRGRRSLFQLLPWAVLLSALAAAALLIFNLPMEMRGSILGGT